MRFQVPQFIEIEDKIFGPLTFKQFIYLAGGGGFTVIVFLFLPKFLAFLVAVPMLIFSAALAFYKLNGKPFINVLEAFVRYALTNKLYVWKKTPSKARVVEKESEDKIEKVYVPKLSQSKLKELTWNLDIKENNNPVTENSQ